MFFFHDAYAINKLWRQHTENALNYNLLFLKFLTWCSLDILILYSCSNFKFDEKMLCKILFHVLYLIYPCKHLASSVNSYFPSCFWSIREKFCLYFRNIAFFQIVLLDKFFHCPFNKFYLITTSLFNISQATNAYSGTDLPFLYVH